jgi:importin subunit alpha-1
MSAENTRLASYKNTGRKEDSRAGRFEGSVELRKAARSEQLQKRRQLAAGNDGANDEDEDSGEPGGSGRPVLGDASANVNRGAVTLAQLPAVLAQVRAGDAATRHAGTRALRVLLSRERQPPIAEVLAAGVLPAVVRFLAHDAEPQLQLEACWVLTNVASGTSEQTKAVVAAGALPLLVKLLGAAAEELREQACWTVGNIAGDGGQLRDLCLQYGVLAPLLQLLAPGAARLSLARNATWTLSNLFRGKDPQPAFEAVAPGLPALVALLHAPDDELVTDAAWAMSYFTDGDGTKIQAALDAGAAARLVQLTQSPTLSIVTPALRALGNIVTGSDTQTQAALDAGLLPALGTLLGHAREGLRKEACWVLSNVLAGSAPQIIAVLQGGLLGGLVENLRQGDYKTRKEACWAFSNLASGGEPAHVRWVAENGAVAPLCGVLALPDPKLLCVALEALTFFLLAGESSPNPDGSNAVATLIEECGGLDRIEELQGHSNDQVYHKSHKIIEKYFAADDDGAGADGMMEAAFSSALVPVGGYAF